MDLVKNSIIPKRRSSPLTSFKSAIAASSNPFRLETVLSVIVGDLSYMVFLHFSPFNWVRIISFLPDPSN